jgi:hypothetical protein
MLDFGSVLSTSFIFDCIAPTSKGDSLSKTALLVSVLKALSCRELLEEKTLLASDLVSNMFVSLAYDFAKEMWLS